MSETENNLWPRKLKGKCLTAALPSHEPVWDQMTEQLRDSNIHLIEHDFSCHHTDALSHGHTTWSSFMQVAVKSRELLTPASPQPTMPVQPDGCAHAELAFTASGLLSLGPGANLSHSCSSVPSCSCPCFTLSLLPLRFVAQLQN